MADISTLQAQTEAFFARHWDKSSPNAQPTWSNKWQFVGEVPNNTFKGCYAWLRENEVVYIGLALNSGLPGYEGHSLGTRISNYWNRKNGEKDTLGNQIYKPSAQLEPHNIDSIITLAFPNNDQEYLAAALENYLIRELSPEINKSYKKRIQA